MSPAKSRRLGLAFRCAARKPNILALGQQQMSNPYEPPKSNTETIPPDHPRPAGITLIAWLFVAFATASTALAYIDDQEGEWVIVLICSILLIYWFRNIVHGYESERKIGVLFGVLIAALNFFGFYEVSTNYEEIERLFYLAEGAYGLSASIYLMKMKDAPFFNK